MFCLLRTPCNLNSCKYLSKDICTYIFVGKEIKGTLISEMFEIDTAPKCPKNILSSLSSPLSYLPRRLLGRTFFRYADTCKSTGCHNQQTVSLHSEFFMNVIFNSFVILNNFTWTTKNFEEFISYFFMFIFFCISFTRHEYMWKGQETSSSQLGHFNRRCPDILYKFSP